MAKAAPSVRFSSDPERFPPVVLARLMIIDIAMPTDQLYYRLQASPDGPWEPEWHQIDKNKYALLAAGMTRGGRVAMAAQSKARPSIYFIDQKGHDTAGNPTWNRRANLGLPAKSAGFKQLVCGRDADGRIEIFGIDQKSGKLWWIYQNPDQIVTKKVKVTPPGSKKPITVTVQETAPPKTPWSAWQEIKGLALADLVLANNVDGRIVLLGHGAKPAQGQLYCNEQSKPRALEPKDWAGWQQLSSYASGPVTSVTVQLDTEGALNVFGIGDGGEVVHSRQMPPGSRTWAPWAAPGMIGETVLSVTAGIDGDGHIALVAQDENKVLHGNQQTNVAFAQWNNWQRIALADDLGAMALAYNANGRLTLFLRTAHEPYQILIRSQVELNSTEWELGWTDIGNYASPQLALVQDVTPGR